MTSHDTYRDRLLDLAYGELGPREAREVRAHVETCEECRAELARMTSTRSAMSALTDEKAPERGEAVLLAAAREVAMKRRPRPFVPTWLWRASVGAVAAAAVAVLAIRFSGLVRSPASQPQVNELVARSAPEPVKEPEPEKKELAAPSPPPTAQPAAPSPRSSPPARQKRAERGDGYGYAAASPTAPGAAAASATADATANAPAAASAAAPAPPAAREEEQRKQKRDVPAAPRAALAEARTSEGSRIEDPIAHHRRLQAEGRLRVDERAFPSCPGESFRRVEQDEQGRVVKLTRRGVLGGSPYQAELFYGEDGLLEAVRYQEGGVAREVRTRGAGARTSDVAGVLAAPGLPARALEPRRAADAGPDAPPACGD